MVIALAPALASAAAVVIRRARVYPVYFIAPTDQGLADGTTPGNAKGGGLGSIQTAINTVGAGDTIGLLKYLPSGAPCEYNNGATTISSDGAANANAKIRITGWNPLTGQVAKPRIYSSRNAWTLPANSETTTNVSAWNAGARIFTLNSGVSHLVFEHLAFDRCGDGCFFFAGTHSGVKLRDMTVYNVKRFVAMASDAAVSDVGSSDADPTFGRISATGFSECFLRFLGTSNNIVTSDCVGNSGRQDGDAFAIGVEMDGAGGGLHHLSFYRCVMSNCHDGLVHNPLPGDFWNADGFSSDQPNDYLYMEDCGAFGCTDAGFDLKAGDEDNPDTWPTLVRCWARDSCINFKYWDNLKLINPDSETPHKRGGSGSPGHFSSQLGGIAHIQGGHAHGSQSPLSAIKTFFNDETSGIISVDGMTVDTRVVNYWNNKGTLNDSNMSGTGVPL